METDICIAVLCHNIHTCLTKAQLHSLPPFTDSDNESSRNQWCHKRYRKMCNWKSNLVTGLRNSAQQYVSQNGKVKDGRPLKKINHKCTASLVGHKLQLWVVLHSNEYCKTQGQSSCPTKTAVDFSEMNLYHKINVGTIFMSSGP
jgi:hypothetical protein